MRESYFPKKIIDNFLDKGLMHKIISIKLLYILICAPVMIE